MKIAALLLWWATWVGCSNPVTPDEDREDDGTCCWDETILVFEALPRAFNERDKDLYETLLADDFRFTESDCGG